MRKESMFDRKKEYIKTLYLIIYLIQYFNVETEKNNIKKKTTIYSEKKDTERLLRHTNVQNKMQNKISKHFFFNQDIKTNFIPQVSQKISQEIEKIVAGIISGAYDIDWTFEELSFYLLDREEDLNRSQLDLIEDDGLAADLRVKPIDFLLALLLGQKSIDYNHLGHLISSLEELIYKDYISFKSTQKYDISIAHLLLKPTNTHHNYQDEDPLIMSKLELLYYILKKDKDEKIDINIKFGITEIIIKRLMSSINEPINQLDLIQMEILELILNRKTYSFLDVKPEIDFMESIIQLKNKSTIIKNIYDSLVDDTSIKKQINQSKDFDRLYHNSKPYIAFLESHQKHIDIVEEIRRRRGR
jgi:hypothetical protein